MKRKMLVLLLGYIMSVSLMGCGNNNMCELNYTFDKAIIRLQNGEVIEVEVKSWTYYKGENLQIETPDGKLYLTSSFNCTLIKE